MTDRGSFTVELSILILSMFFVILVFFSLASTGFASLYGQAPSSQEYEEAFLSKIEKLRHEKVLREER